MRAREPGDQWTAIERALESIPPAIRFRVPPESRAPKADPKPVEQPGQRGLFDDGAPY